MALPQFSVERSRYGKNETCPAATASLRITFPSECPLFCRLVSPLRQSMALLLHVRI